MGAHRRRDGSRRVHLAGRRRAPDRQGGAAAVSEGGYTPTKKPTTQRSDKITAEHLAGFLGKYSMAALSSDLVASYRDHRIAAGKSNNTVRIELALLSNLFTIAIQEWGLGLTHNPVSAIRKPSPGKGRDRRLNQAEEKRLLQAVDQHSNPMLGWIVRITIETGMRQSEILSLRTAQVDLASRVASLTDTKNNSARTVPLTMGAASAFKAALENPLRPKTSDLIFFGEPGKDGVCRPYQFGKIWAGIKESVQIGFRSRGATSSVADAASRSVNERKNSC